MASPDERKGENEAFFREVNERLEEHAVEKRAARGSFEIICECSLETCTQRLSVTFADYESVRADETRFILAIGHADAANRAHRGLRASSTTSSRRSASLPRWRLTAIRVAMSGKTEA